ncbi:MAG: UvrB/UvrC motif-containing protein [candidate division KSB1 bacterium]|nr:UvrB/UvrC motif-containing protein [candidate division KSB1 bacterium]
MLCEICHSRPATVQLTQIVHTQKLELHICQPCAEAHGLTLPFAVLPHLLGGLLLQAIGQAHPSVPVQSMPSCPHCGHTYRDVEQTGLLGCSECYRVFAEPLRTLLRRIHGSAKHIGSRPPHLRRRVAVQSPEEIRRALEEAVAREEYERAAELRDLLRDLTRGTSETRQ